jgi:hypothetical protein
MTGASRRHRAANLVALVETTDPHGAVPQCVPLLDAGYDVVLCAGPRADQSCAALDGQPCPLVGDADVVINAVGDGATRAALARYVRDAAPDLPLAFVVDDDVDGVPPGCIRARDVHAIAALLPTRPPSDLTGTTLTIRMQRPQPQLVGSRSRP